MYEGMCYGVVPYAVYDGTNSAAILAKAEDQYGTWSVSENNGVLTITKTYAEVDENNVHYHDDWTANVGDYILFGNLGGMVGVYSEAQFEANYAIVLEAVNEPVSSSLGLASVPTLAANAQQTVSVMLKPAMPDANYTPAAIVVGSLNLLGSLEVQSVTVVDASHVSVVVKNKGLVSLGGGQVLVQAVSN